LKGYLIQARKWHPDRCSTTDCEERFKNISEAYKILSDHDLKLIYDQSGLKDVKVAQQQAGFDVVEQTKEV
jgi:DnaJ-class molecular chaperone